MGLRLGSASRDCEYLGIGRVSREVASSRGAENSRGGEKLERTMFFVPSIIILNNNLKLDTPPDSGGLGYPVVHRVEGWGQT